MSGLWVQHESRAPLVRLPAAMLRGASVDQLPANTTPEAKLRVALQSLSVHLPVPAVRPVSCREFEALLDSAVGTGDTPLLPAQRTGAGTDSLACDACSLYVKGLARDTTELLLYQWFSPFGALTSCKVYTDAGTARCKGVAFVNFANRSDALQAQAVLHGVSVQHGHKLHIAVQAPRAVRRAVQALTAELSAATSREPAAFPQ